MTMYRGTSYIGSPCMAALYIGVIYKVHAYTTVCILHGMERCLSKWLPEGVVNIRYICALVARCMNVNSMSSEVFVFVLFVVGTIVRFRLCTHNHNNVMSTARQTLRCCASRSKHEDYDFRGLYKNVYRRVAIVLQIATNWE